ncbi:MAG: hypothetical protein KBF96_01860 [Ignavibacteria bacterium]|jgi:hypothetical protein|nr:hypothetical protein [Ignavibacteria bacterium]
MEALKINKFLETFENFSSNEKEYVFEVINNQLSKESRKRIIKRVKESRSNLKKGKVKTGNLEELYKDLEND